MLLRFKRKLKNSTPDVIVCGSSLAAMVSAMACKLHGLNIHWVTSTNFFREILTDNECYDSLPPEGVRYLRHILSQDIIESLSQGSFDGIVRDGSKMYFDKYLGLGIQIISNQLKKFLYRSLESKIPIYIDSGDFVIHGENFIQLRLRSGNKLKTPWIIDGQGENSNLPYEKPNILSPDIWVERYFEHKNIVEAKVITDHVEFSCNNEGWYWQAYDSIGRKCITRWVKNYGRLPEEKSENGQKQHYNTRWYKRPKAYNGRLILVGSTFCRMDPASGLGMTQQIMSALEAAKMISTLKRDSSFAKDQYAKKLEDSFNNVAILMKSFYERYKVRVNLCHLDNMPIDKHA